MATTDVASFVTPVYTPTLLVTNDASILTQADLTALTLSLANRIEFVRDLAPDATDTPEYYAAFREDWLGGIASGSTRFLGEFPWTQIETSSGGLSVFQDDGTDKNPGGLVVSTPGTLGNEQYSWFVGPGATSTPFSFAKLEQMTIVCKIQSNTSTLGVPVFRIGLASDADDTVGGSNALGITYNPQVSGANWLRTKRVAGVGSTAVLAAVVLGEYVVFQFKRNVTGIDVFVNGTLAETILTAALPSGSCTFGGYQEIGSAAGATLITSVVDLVSLRTSPTARNGV